MDSNRTWIPMMLFSGIMNTMFFMSMMYLMGIAMNPHESAMVAEGRGEGHSNNSQEIQSVADNSNNSHNTSNEQQDYASDGVDY